MFSIKSQFCRNFTPATGDRSEKLRKPFLRKLKCCITFKNQYRFRFIPHVRDNISFSIFREQHASSDPEIFAYIVITPHTPDKFSVTSTEREILILHFYLCAGTNNRIVRICKSKVPGSIINAIKRRRNLPPVNLYPDTLFDKIGICELKTPGLNRVVCFYTVS
ncbi:MAG: hypothetical protein BWX96_02771 [Bacteroidetes bacterium ADurb.Bin145]|nr:MAG: hypothetical protein BWX96_02771 [Bacteroidetes bacterium ADurb.Bin145]